MPKPLKIAKSDKTLEQDDIHWKREKYDNVKRKNHIRAIWIREVEEGEILREENGL